ncbi:MAG: MBL fold metallo-hydrolase [Bacteriovoracaceae bacterium]
MVNLDQDEASKKASCLTGSMQCSWDDVNTFGKKLQNMKIYSSLFIFLALNSVKADAFVNFKWLGTTNFVLSDNKTTLMFDPAITRASITDFLPFKKVKTDQTEVEYWFKRCKLNRLNAIFVNHTHFDHAADVSYVTKKYGGVMHGSSSAINLGLGQGVPANQLKQIKAGDEITIGDFKIKVFSTPHAPHFLGVSLMEGNIENNMQLENSVWDFKVGDTFSFLITHPQGSILFQAIGKIYENDPLKDFKVDVLLLTIANRPSSEHLIQKRVIPSGARKIIPLHYDNFFYSMNRTGPIDHFWGIKLEEFKQKAKQFNVVTPDYCQENILF